MSQLSLRFQALYMFSRSVNAPERAVDWTTDMRNVRVIRHASQVQYMEPQETTLYSSPCLCNRSTLDIGVFGYIGVF
jgi:hypothetical protein